MDCIARQEGLLEVSVLGEAPDTIDHSKAKMQDLIPGALGSTNILSEVPCCPMTLGVLSLGSFLGGRM